MNRLCVETRGIGSWRERLASPEKQWRRGFSAMETAASWERQAGRLSGLPEPLELLFQESVFRNPVLMVGIAEHKVPLAGQGGGSQCDVWALPEHKRRGGLTLGRGQGHGAVREEQRIPGELARGGEILELAAKQAEPLG